MAGRWYRLFARLLLELSVGLVSGYERALKSQYLLNVMFQSSWMRELVHDELECHPPSSLLEKAF